MKIDIKDLDKAKVLASLYNHSKMANCHFFYSEVDSMTIEEARRLLKVQTQFNYFKGRSLKVDLSGDSFESRYYDNDNGRGAAKKALLDVSQGVIEKCMIS